MSNVFICFLSEMHLPNPKEFPNITTKEDLKINYYKSDCSEKLYRGLLTDEAATYHVIDLLKEKNQCVDKFIIICSQRVRNPIFKIAERWIPLLNEQIGLGTKKVISALNYYIESVDEFIRNRNYSAYKDWKENKVQIVNIVDEPEESDIYKCMTEVVQYIKDGDELYLDINGGYRDAVSILIGLCRMLRTIHPNIQYGKNIYIPFTKRAKEQNEVVNKIEDRTFLFSMFDLISGIDEFEKNGSVHKLEEYYKDKQGSMKQLLNAMGHVSDSLKFCFSNDILAAFEELNQVFAQWNDTGNETESELEAFLFKYVKTTYGKLVGNVEEGKIQLMELVDWCVEHDLIQPAMCLLVDKLPDYLADNNLLYVEKQKQGMMQQYFPKKDRYKSYDYYVFTELIENMSNGNLYGKSFKNGIKKMFQESTLSKKDELEKAFDFIKLLNRDESLKDYIVASLAISESKSQLKTVQKELKNEKFVEFIERKLDEYKSNKDIVRDIVSYCIYKRKAKKNEKLESLVDEFLKKPNELILKNIVLQNSIELWAKNSKKDDKKISRAQRYCNNITQQLICSDCYSKYSAQLRDLLETYFDIKDIRNASFHNGEHESISLKELKCKFKHINNLMVSLR